jgi:general stress protein YciG
MEIALAVPSEGGIMVGKVNLPPDADKRKDLKGAATGGAGLTAVDEERAASMADEGGVSGAEVEGRPKKKKNDVADEKSRGRRGGR